MKKTIIALLSLAVLISSFVPTTFAADTTYPKVNTFKTTDFSPFKLLTTDLTNQRTVSGFKGKTADDTGFAARRPGGNAYARISMNETIPVNEADNDKNYAWTYMKYSFNYLVEGKDSVITYLSGAEGKSGQDTNNCTIMSTTVGSDKMKAGQWNHVDYVIGFKRRTSGSVYSNYQVFTYLNGEYIGTTGGDVGSNGYTYFNSTRQDALRIEFYDTTGNGGYNLYLDDIEFMPYTDAYNGRTTADSLIKTPVPTIDTALASVKNGTVYPYGTLNVSDIKDARVYSNSTFGTQLTDGAVSVGNVIVAEKDGVIAYYPVTDVPNNYEYEVIANENFNSGSLGSLIHTFGAPNGYEVVSGFAGKQASDKVVKLIKERANTPIDCLHFAYTPKANSYLTIDFTFLPASDSEFSSLRVLTGNGSNFAGYLTPDMFNKDRWNNVKYIISFDENCKYRTKSYVNGELKENNGTLRTEENFKGAVRIGTAGNDAGLCHNTYLDNIRAVEYIGKEPEADAMPQLKEVEGTKASLSKSTGTFIVDGALNVSALRGTNGEAVRAYSYDEQTRTIGEEIAVVDAATSQIVVVEGANGTISYYFVQPAFSIERSLVDEENSTVNKGDELFNCKYTYTVKAINNGDNDKEIYVAMGRYDKDGKLKNFVAAKDTISNNTSNFEKQVSIDLTNETLGVDDYIAVFTWDANMKPYTNSFKTK